MRENEIVSKTSAWLNTFLDKEGYKLLKTEYVPEDGVRYLRIYIDLTEKEVQKRRDAMAVQQKESELQTAEPEEPDETGKLSGEASETEETEELLDPAVGINDCALVSRRLSKWLDKEDFIPDEYMLEVCSKGYLDDEK